MGDVEQPRLQELVTIHEAAQGVPAAPQPMQLQLQVVTRPDALVQWTPGGRKLRFSPDDLAPLPEKWSGEGHGLAKKLWAKKVPIFVRKALEETHFQHMTLAELRGALEKSVEEGIRKEKAGKQERKRKRNEARGLGLSGEHLTEVVLLRNMVGPGEVDDELRQDVMGEMGRYGRVVSVSALELGPPVPEHEAVRVFVRFATSAEASNAQRALHFRLFGGRRIAACFFPLERFEAGDLDPYPGEKPVPERCLEDPQEEVNAEGEQPPPIPEEPKAPPSLPAEVLALIILVERAMEQPGEAPCLKLLKLADPEAANQIEEEQKEMERRTAE
eukprot:Hpha_TRINITY_DN23475_c0_g1::TRINITY_DN23475_c0_g1_i1::g.113977::m.113977/K12840/RBM17, SPF45; splicing factor 45